MANAFTPNIPEAFDGEMVFNMESYVVADTFSKYVESMSIVHRPKFVVKRTGFEGYKHLIHKHSGNDVLVDIMIVLNGGMPRWLMQQLTQLAKGVLGAGMELAFRDDWWSSYTYTCRWVNASDFVENSTLSNGGTMELQSWAWAVIT